MKFDTGHVCVVVFSVVSIKRNAPKQNNAEIMEVEHFLFFERYIGIPYIYYLEIHPIFH